MKETKRQHATKCGDRGRTALFSSVFFSLPVVAAYLVPGTYLAQVGGMYSTKC